MMRNAINDVMSYQFRQWWVGCEGGWERNTRKLMQKRQHKTHSVVVRGADLHDLHAAQSLRGDQPDELQRLAWEEAAGLGPARARHERRLDGIDVVAHVYGVAPVPRALERDLGDLVDAHGLDVVHGEDVRLAIDHVRHGRAGDLPPPDANLHEILRIHVGEVRGVEVRRGVHTLVEVLLLNVGVTIDVDDADVLGGDGCQTSDGGKSNRMIPVTGCYD